MRILRTSLAAVAIACVASLSACIPNIGDIIGGGGSSSPASVSGKWSTILTSNHGSSNDVDLELNISQSTGSISAAQAVILSNSACEFGADFLAGTVKANQVAFTLAFGTGHPTATFTGSVSSNGLTMTGNYKLPSGDCSPSDSGTWAATKFGDSSGSYDGQFVSGVNQRTIGVIALVQEDATNNLQVTANLTNGGCVVLNLTGTAIGSVLQLENANNTITILAQAANPNYATLTTAYTVGGTTCGTADDGTGSLSKTTANVVAHSDANHQLNPMTSSLFEKIRETPHAVRN
ncbi:MAG: hypothetical protein WB987_16565 [Candidatus Acidiferrales bacterium]